MSPPAHSLAILRVEGWALLANFIAVAVSSWAEGVSHGYTG